MPEALRHPPSPPERDRASARAAAAWQLLVIFAVALGVRLVHLAEVRDLPTFHTLVMDAARYDALARRVLDEGFRPRTAFYQAPLYPPCTPTCWLPPTRSPAARCSPSG